MKNDLDTTTLKALEKCLLGLVVTETTNEYVLDETTNQMKLVKQKVVEKSIPPNADLIKIIYQKQDEEIGYKDMTDEQLEAEKQRLLNELKEEQNASRKSKNKGQV